MTNRAPKTQSAVDTADQIELAVFASRRGRLSIARISELVGSYNGQLDDEDLIEELTGRALTELRRRLMSCGQSYPFSVDDNAVRLEAEEFRQQAYLFMLLLSARPETRERRNGYWPDRFFERLTAAALKVWTGGDSQVFAETATTGSSGIHAALESLGDLLGLEAHPELARASRQDHGLDVIAWRSFRNRPDGVPLVLCQCTVGRTNLVGKAREIAAGEWSLLLSVTTSTIISAIAVPYVLPTDYAYWWDLKANSELVLDRVRLLELLESATSMPAELVELVDCLRVMVEHHVPDLLQRLAVA